MSTSRRQALQCPITKELMVDPVVAQDGYTYDRPSIEQHWTNQLQGDPFCPNFFCSFPGLKGPFQKECSSNPTVIFQGIMIMLVFPVSTFGFFLKPSLFFRTAADMAF